jgi:hypothetical protein
MISRILIEFCDANMKYDVYIDEGYWGKHYDLIEALDSIKNKIIYLMEKEIKEDKYNKIG